MKNSVRKNMKTAACLLLAAVLTTGAAMSASAGIFSDYNDYPNSDGTYSYYFMQGIKVTMDEEWYQKTFVQVDDSGAVFYHKDSYQAYKAEGFEGGGRLFSLGASVNTSFQDLPSFVYIGFDEENAMNYYAELPTDYQAYAADEAIRAEYDALWSGVRDVIAGIEIMPDEKQDAKPQTLLGGWSIAEDSYVTKELGRLLQQAEGYPEDEKYEPVALLATQVVAGTNYCILCQVSPSDSNQPTAYVYVYLYADLQGGSQILEVQDIQIGLGAAG